MHSVNIFNHNIIVAVLHCGNLKKGVFAHSKIHVYLLGIMPHV